MKKTISMILTIVLFLQILHTPLLALGAVYDADMNYAILTLSSPFVNGTLKKKALIKNGEVLMDAGTLADLAGYECTYWGDTLIFDRGFRRIAVNPEGNVRYYYSSTSLQLSMVVEYNGYTYIPFAAGLRMLGCTELAQGNTIAVLANTFSLVDSYNKWDLSDLVFDYERDLPIKSVSWTKIGIAIANIFENGFTYITNTITLLGPNYDKYRDAAIYYLTYENENTATSVLESEYDLINKVVSTFGGDFGELLSDDLIAFSETAPSYLVDQDLWDLIDTLGAIRAANRILDTAAPVVKAALLYSKVKDNVSTQQLDSLKIVLTPYESDESWFYKNVASGNVLNNSLSMYTGVNNAVGLAEKDLNTYIGVGLLELISGSIDLGTGYASLVNTGFTIGNTIMQLALSGTFEDMDKYDIAFCLKDMQEMTLAEYDRCRELIRNGSTDESDYIYAFNAMQFLTNSTIAMNQLLIEIYEDEADAKDAVRYWKNSISACSSQYYASNITLEECIRDTIPTDLLNVSSDINNEVKAGNTSVSGLETRYAAYIKKIKEIESAYGHVKSVNVDRHMPYLTGLCFLSLIDFDQDGDEELLLVYEYDEMQDSGYLLHNYKYEICSYEDRQLVLLDTGSLFGGDGGSASVILTDYKNQMYLVTGASDSFGYFYYHGYSGDDFGIVREVLYDDGWYENGTINGVAASGDQIKSEQEEWLENETTYSLNYSTDNEMIFELIDSTKQQLGMSAEEPDLMSAEEIYQKLVSHYEKGTEDAEGSDMIVMEGEFINDYQYDTIVRCGVPGNDQATQQLYQLLVDAETGAVLQIKTGSSFKAVGYNIKDE